MNSRGATKLLLLASLLMLGSFSGCVENGSDPAVVYRDISSVAQPLSEEVKEIPPLELERMIKYVNDRAKDVVLSGITPSGKTIDCVPIETQSHVKALLAAGKPIPTRPTDVEDKPEQSNSVEDDNVLGPEAIEGSNICPTGTFPRVRVTLDDLKRLGSMEAFFNNKDGGKNLESTVVGYDVAAVNKTVSHNGLKASLNLWDPYTYGNHSTGLYDISNSTIYLSRGSQRIEAGWHDHYYKYGDTVSHFYIFHIGSNGGCFNTDCSAFQQTNNSIALGAKFTNYSTVGGSQYYIDLKWHRDESNGRWWLQFGDIWVGYYPASVFGGSNGLAFLASYFDVGGMVDWETDDQLRSTTHMGSGNWPSTGWGYAAFTRNIEFRNTSLTWIQATGLGVYTTNFYCYDIDKFESSSSWGTYIYFGGPGRNPACWGL